MIFRIHKEGSLLLLVLAFALIIVNGIIWKIAPIALLPLMIVSVGFYLLVLQFFRNPVRTIPLADNHLVYAPADGRVCVGNSAVEDYFTNPYNTTNTGTNDLYVDALNLLGYPVPELFQTNYDNRITEKKEILKEIETDLKEIHTYSGKNGPDFINARDSLIEQLKIALKLGMDTPEYITKPKPGMIIDIVDLCKEFNVGKYASNETA